jgi:hypothetical protein
MKQDCFGNVFKQRLEVLKQNGVHLGTDQVGKECLCYAMPVLPVTEH